MSKVYLLQHNPIDPGDFDTTFSVDFDVTDPEPFAVIAFRLPLKSLSWLLKEETRFIQVRSDEISELLRAISVNENESAEEREISKSILHGSEHAAS